MNTYDPFFDIKKFLTTGKVKLSDHFAFVCNGQVVQEFTGADLLHYTQEHVELYEAAQASLLAKANEITLRAKKN